MSFSPIVIPDFNQREEKLKEIYRYSAYPVMFYRTNLWVHSHRVSWLVEELAEFAVQTFPAFDVELCRTMALVHDDAEMLTGDVNLVHKVSMTVEELHKIEQQEEKAIVQMAKTSPARINNYPYQQMLEGALYKNTPESQVMSLADKLDAYGESFHELLAGNTNFLLPFGTSPIEIYTRILRGFSKKFPALEKLLSQDHPLLKAPQEHNLLAITQVGQPHTHESLQIESGIPHYEFWKKLTVRRLGDEGIAMLTHQKELPSKEKMMVKEFRG